LNIETKIPKSSTSEVSVTPENTGDFVGHCAVFCGTGHGQMTLTIHVVE
jgi:cytochrome c oxidase subunit 2